MCSRWKPFHIIWFQIIRDARREELKASSWKSGPLYGSKKDAFIQHTTFTMAVLLSCPGYEPESYERFADASLANMHYDYWTVLLLNPSGTEFPSFYSRRLASIILFLISGGLRKAADAWREIQSHFKSILDDENPILDPDKHDALLFDDNMFSRSRKYFWAVDSLELFKTQIADTLREWVDFWAAREQMIRAWEQVDLKNRIPGSDGPLSNKRFLD